MAQTDNFVPQHIAIIMDGNGRWAKKRGLPRTAGHSAGGEAFRRIANYCRTLGVKYLTVYAFSTENWKRSADEVAGIMKLLGKYLEEALKDMEKNHVRFCSREYHEVQVNFCLNYGGRDEIIRAVKSYAQDVAEGKCQPEQLTEELFDSYLDSAGVPDPELVIRPSGEQRTSNFLPWQTVYSEFVFMDVLWPDFGPKDLDAAIEEYKRRNRRFGSHCRLWIWRNAAAAAVGHCFGFAESGNSCSVWHPLCHRCLGAFEGNRTCKEPQIADLRGGKWLFGKYLERHRCALRMGPFVGAGVCFCAVCRNDDIRWEASV